MVRDNESICPNCGGYLKYYDEVGRVVRSKGGKKYQITIRRLLCQRCGCVHRELPTTLLPYKHYEAGVIGDFLSGAVSSYDIEYEDYPCESTVKNWLKEFGTN